MYCGFVEVAKVFVHLPVQYKVIYTTLYLLTSVISLRAVSQPKLKSLPGTLLLIVAGMTTMGMQNSGYLPRASYS